MANSGNTFRVIPDAKRAPSAAPAPIFPPSTHTVAPRNAFPARAQIYYLYFCFGALGCPGCEYPPPSFLLVFTLFAENNYEDHDEQQNDRADYVHGYNRITVVP